MEKKTLILLSVIGVLSALFLIALRNYTVLDFETFAYLIALVRIPTFFVLVFLCLSLLLMGTQIAGKRLFTFGLFLPSAIVPYLFHILSFVFFPDFITPNTRDKASWLYLTSSAFTVLALSAGVFYSKLSFLQKRPKFYALFSLLSSSLISLLVVLYYPYLPKAYEPGFGSTPIRDALELALSVWTLLILFYTIKQRPFGHTANSVISGALVFFSLSYFSFIFYVAFTDFLIVASSVYRLISYILLAYAILVLQKINVSKNVLKDSMNLLSSIAKAEPRTEAGGVLSFSLGKALEEGFVKSVSVFSVKDGRLVAQFHDLRESIEEPYQLFSYSWMLAKREGYIGKDQHFRVLDDYILISKGQFDKEDPVLHIHLLNVETLLYSYFRQYVHFNELLQEKSKELNRLYLLLETSEYATQAYNNIETFSKQVLDRLDHVLGMDGSIFYMFNKGSETLEKLVLSTNFIKTFQKEEARIFAHNVIAVSDIARFEEYAMFVKFEQDSYQAGIIGLRKVRTFEKDDFLFLKTIANQLFHVVRLMKVIEDLEKAQLSVRFLSEYDPLTLLYNRRTFEELLQERIEQSQRTMSVFSLIFIDVDGFKLINDTYGYSVGDMALRFLASAIKENLRRVDIACRLGGDEFAVLLLSDKHTAKNVADRIIRNIKENPLEVDGKKISLSVSAVIISYPHDGYSVEDLISTGELLMRDVKRQGKGTVFVSEEETKREVEIVRGFEKTLLEGPHEEAVVPYLQEIVDVKSGKLYAFEVLMRLKFEGRLLSAGEFIPTAERLGLMQKLDLLLAEKVFKEYGRFGGEDILLFFNMVPENANEEFMELIKAKADEYSVPIDRLVFEITERSAVQDILSMSEFVREFKNLGFKFAIDDFGSGYSSFYYLKYLPVNYLKIEGEFIKSLPRSSTDTAFVKAIVNVARELGIKTVAEFVEDESILQVIKELGIDYAQGYYIGKPESLEDKIRKFFSKG